MVITIITSRPLPLLISAVVTAAVTILAFVLVVVVVVIARQCKAAQRKQYCHTQNDCLDPIHRPLPAGSVRTFAVRLHAHLDFRVLAIMMPPYYFAAAFLNPVREKFIRSYRRNKTSCEVLLLLFLTTSN